MMEATSVFQVSSFFIQKGINERRPITQLKLQKLLYFAQGAFVSLNDGLALFEEEVEAWKYGPVVRVVYDQFRIFGNRPITKGELDDFNDEGSETFLNRWRFLQDGVLIFLEQIWDEFGGYSGYELVELTHMKGSPWFEVYKKFEGQIPNHLVISLKRMKSYFDRTIILE